MTINQEPYDANEKPKNDDARRAEWRDYLPHATIVILILLIVVSIFGIVNSLNPKVVDNNDLAFSLKPVANLTTVEVKVAKIGVQVKANYQLCSFGGEYLVNGTIEAGVNLSDFSASNISYDNKKDLYTVSLQRPTITRCEFTQKRYHDWQGACGSIDKSSIDSVATYVTSTSMIQDVVDGGIIPHAEREASILIENIIKTLSNRNTEVEFVDATTPMTLPPSCNPEIPRGWTQKEDGTWKPS